MEPPPDHPAEDGRLLAHARGASDGREARAQKPLEAGQPGPLDLRPVAEHREVIAAAAAAANAPALVIFGAAGIAPVQFALAAKAAVVTGRCGGERTAAAAVIVIATAIAKSLPRAGCAVLTQTYMYSLRATICYCRRRRQRRLFEGVGIRPAPSGGTAGAAAAIGTPPSGPEHDAWFVLLFLPPTNAILVKRRTSPSGPELLTEKKMTLV